MGKRFYLLFLFIISVSILAACNSEQNAASTLPSSSVPALQTEEAPSETEETPNTTDVTEEIIDDISLNYIMLAQAYVDNAEENDDFATYYQASDRVEAYPILGTYLEPTKRAAYLFYQNEYAFAIAFLSFDSAGNVDGTPTCKEMTSLPLSVVEAQSIEDCYMELTDCISEHPDFDILGLVLASQGYPAVYPVGRQQGEATIKYMANQACNFSLVDPFTTIEDGYQAFQDYLSKRHAILSEITIYPWNDMPFYESDYLSIFKSTSWSERENGDYSYLDAYDSWVAVPLLSSDLAEDVYVLYLLYYHNQLIAEIVIENKYDGTEYTCSSVWENVAAKSADGQYIPLETSQYVSTLNHASAHKSSLVCQGVVYDNGKLIPVGMQEGKLMAFYSSTNTVAEYK